MSEPRAILATFSDWRPVKGRKVLQLIFEVPVEQTADVLTKLGAPMPHEDKWCGIALVERCEPLIAPTPSEPIKIERQKERKRFAELPASQQAALRCDDTRFQNFLANQLPQRYAHTVANAAPESKDHEPDIAAILVREICGVKSRADIPNNPTALERWLTLEAKFQTYLADEQYGDRR